MALVQTELHLGSVDHSMDEELDYDLKKYHLLNIDKKVTKPKIIEKGKFGEDGWSISIGDVEDGDT